MKKKHLLVSDEEIAFVEERCDRTTKTRMKLLASKNLKGVLKTSMAYEIKIKVAADIPDIEVTWMIKALANYRRFFHQSA